ncbi:nitroreductase family deazaflavin-dependent oxidoreductase [Kribbella speibonae]|uniref:Nitroreductase family deazaflavin-dependent oxidoreductase n=1 Tax=Kribbella speibonae TaxID=1572660 RepID=A0A4R0JB52_9ACTN|nr:nitroreductase family deazaflavin-dependent oxidoreductase [Kribbella speibonae]TCC26699.1 nitroreductase family deazaflavin-dependent oxidoreductase [Kribbella speibonae]TCC38785.1 nitroreductase family deazaflavin-dependent oxidoreductase [Kribbella speibonae]
MTSNVDDEYAPSTAGWVRDQVEKVTAAGTTDAVDIMGMRVVLLTMRGAKSGKIRKVPLMRVEHDGVYAAVASLGGAPKNPVWYYNLKADPKLTLQDGETTKEYVAREVEGAEYDEWWPRAVAAYPPYAEYQTKTTRKIPLFLLDPVE